MKQRMLAPDTRLTEKQYILGRKTTQQDGILTIGRYYALDSSLGAPVSLDVLRPHVVLICGKRGYGKSYTIGVLLEEIARLPQHIRNNLGVLVFDTLGIFWTLQFPNKAEKKSLKHWGCMPQGFPIHLVVPKPMLSQYQTQEIPATGFSLQVSELTPFHWCQLFHVEMTSPIGIAISRAVLELKSTGQHYSLEQLCAGIHADKRTDTTVKDAAENFFAVAQSWNLFDPKGSSITDFVRRGILTVLDLSHLPNQTLKIIVASLLGERIFEERVKERKVHEQKKMGFSVTETGMPMVWVAVDEAQVFLPADKHVLSKEVFINEWMRQGRQPGLSLLLATQRPSAVDGEVLSHSDIIICHRLTAQEDIDALSRIRPTYMHGDIREAIKKIGDEKGVALVIDDTSETTHVIKIRSRLSWHGGADALVFEPSPASSRDNI